MVTKRDILNIAFRLFASKGFHETSMENIADALGLKKQSLYSHFKSKNEIVLNVLKDQAAQLNNEISLILTEYREKPTDMLLKFVFMRLMVFLSRRDRLLLWKRTYLLDINDEFKDILENSGWKFDRVLMTELGRILRARYPKFLNEERLDAFFLSYTIFIQGYLDWMLVSGYDVNTAESIWESFWSGAKSHFT
ncbi:transcriptional regulator, TetR family [Sporobacter termitidis DSM 10068]|uniref:Transcriptional regulator, TetR family n=1 Tax=Sporobacter termitidis DSM 10068 TaxID=1123282 RepID=A0A1M5Z9I4_9FIRM|nr:TetR/AcrR family transcriptional regulator [Sporobacter termitidis]SHI20916.1 transcriptional regulator, TetR family [Sporobacter termitidis DSM 10068]